jgi:sulfotransferase 6B1
MTARLLRRAARRARQALRYGALSASPVFFANSFPKSGTHLLTQVMQGFTQLGPVVDSGLPAVVTFDGFTGRQRDPDEIVAELHRFLPGDIGYGHVHATPEAVDWFCQPGVAAYFILRDPRDVVVSHVHYIAEMAPNHIHHRYYHEVLHTFDERLRASITGVPVEELAKAGGGKPVYEPLPDIRTRFAPYLGWLEHSEVLVLRYEDFTTDRRVALGRVLDHAVKRGFQLSAGRQPALQRLEDSIDPSRSPTFRSGKIGGWQKSFTDSHKVLFAQIAGDLVSALGYE